MKQILADITPMGSNNLFVTHYWPDKQTDPPLHYHEDYMLCLTLHVRGQRIMDDAVEDFTEKDLVLINPGSPCSGHQRVHAETPRLYPLFPQRRHTPGQPLFPARADRHGTIPGNLLL